MQAIILAGGRGPALWPLTDRNPRSMVPLANKPLVRYQIELLARHGVTDVILCIDYLAERFDRYFRDTKVPGVSIRFHRDSEPRGTAGAVKAVEQMLDGDTVLVLNGHILSNISVQELLAFHKSRSAEATIYLSANSNPNRYGVVLTDTSGRVTRFIEKPALVDEAPTDTINGGIYVFERSVFRHIPDEAEYYSLERSVFPALLAESAPMYGMLSEAYWQDIASLMDYRKAQEDILVGRVHVQMSGGAEGEHLWVGEGSSIHPTADISGPVAIGKSVTIGKDVKIRGPASIGSNCRVEEGALIDRSTVWRGSIIERGAKVRGCILGDDCTVKENAAVQEGSVLGDGAVVASYFATIEPTEQAIRRNRIRFGTDGWRGIIADDFTGENVRLVTRSVVEVFRSADAPGDPIVVIGYDNRSQSEYFAAEAAKVVAASGLKAVLSREACSSPAVSYLAKFLHARGGLMITASHNPPAFNGLKIKAYYGGSASPALISRIEQHLNRILDDSDATSTLHGSSQEVELRDFCDSYLNHLAGLVDLSMIRSANQKVVIDAMHGSGGGYLPKIFRSGGIENFIEIRGDRNPVFGGINPEPIESNMAALSEAVLQRDASVGIALDGDADRVGAVDSQGRFIDSHRIFAVLLKHLVEQRGWTGGVVKTVSTTKMIDKLCEKYCLTLYETPIGFKYICDLMLQQDILIGGEESGGIGVKNHLPERDGVLMGLLLLEAMAARRMTLDALIGEIMAEFGLHEYSRLDLHPEQSAMHRIISAMQSYQPAEIVGRTVAEVSRKDGTKITFTDQSWLLLRPSGTEPLVRVYAEAPSKAEVKMLLDAGQRVVEEA